MKIGRVKERARVKTIEMMAKKTREREPTAARWPKKKDGNKRAVNVAEENKKGRWNQMLSGNEWRLQRR